MRNDAVLKALKAIETANGRLTPEAVVKAAKSPRHILHPRFEWDDGKAAHQWRIEQARELIRGVEVNIRVDDRQVRSVVYLRDPSAGERDQGYRSLDSIRENRDETREAIVAEFARAAAHLRRAREIAVALGRAAEVEVLVQNVLGLSQSIEASA